MLDEGISRKRMMYEGTLEIQQNCLKQKYHSTGVRPQIYTAKCLILIPILTDIFVFTVSSGLSLVTYPEDRYLELISKGFAFNFLNVTHLNFKRYHQGKCTHTYRNKANIL